MKWTDNGVSISWYTSKFCISRQNPSHQKLDGINNKKQCVLSNKSRKINQCIKHVLSYGILEVSHVKIY